MSSGAAAADGLTCAAVHRCAFSGGRLKNRPARLGAPRERSLDVWFLRKNWPFAEKIQTG